MADKTEVRTSVRNLVEFILRSGNIDNRRASSPENAMLEGGRIHRMIQKRMGADYRAEVALKYRYETEQYTVIVEGRMALSLPCRRNHGFLQMRRPMGR